MATVKALEPGHAAPKTRYAAFISYSHAADADLGPALQSALQRFAKPWYQARAFRVFIDRTGLPIAAKLRARIEKALSESAYLIFLASPASARSEWVSLELDWWLRHRSADRLLVVLTEGTLVWDGGLSDFRSGEGSAWPARLAKAFAEEPSYLDLTWACGTNQTSLRNPKFAAAVAGLSATLRGVSLDDLVEEEARQHRFAMTLLRVGVVTLVVLALGAVLAAIGALRSSKTAGELLDRDRKAAALDDRAKASRQWAEDAIRQLGIQPMESIRLAAQAVRLEENPESLSALRRALAGDLEPTSRFPGHRERECYAVYSPDGTRVLSWGDSIAVLRDATTLRPSLELRGHAHDILHAAFSDDARWITTTDEQGEIRVWSASDGRVVATFQHAGATSARMGPGGKQVVTAAPGGEAILWDLATGARVAEVRLGSVLDFGTNTRLMAFHPSGERVAFNALPDPVVVDARDGRTLFRLVGHSREVRSLQFSPDGTWLLSAGEDGTARLWLAGNGQLERTLKPETEMSGLLEARFSPDGRRVATRDTRRIILWDTATGNRGATIEYASDAPGGVGLFQFNLSGSCLLTATFDGATAALWETATGLRLAELAGTDGEIRTLSFHPDGRRALVGSIFAHARVYDCEMCGSTEELLVAADQRLRMASSEKLGTEALSTPGSAMPAR
ncbi:MAG: TIR domain-containing protein [Verrucomicrobiales bacterium]|nr:TIR domain-containing protein [Verrucomicrobiales bacterium]